MIIFDQLFTGLTLATMDPARAGYGYIRDAAVGTRDGKFIFIGPMDRLPRDYDSLSHTDCTGLTALPGLIDCHTHAVFGGTRAWEYEERLNGASYTEIAKKGGGILSTVKATRETSERSLVQSATKRLKKLKASGATTIEVKSGYGLTLEDELKMLRAAKAAAIRAGVGLSATLLGAHALPPEYSHDPDAYIDLVCREMIPAAEGLAHAVDAFCEGIGFTPRQVTRVMEAAQKHGLNIKLHADQLSDLGGGGLAASMGALSADHLEYASDASIAKMAEMDTVAVLLPGAFYSLRETVLPPVAKFRTAGVPMALATDMNPGTSPVTNLQLMINMGCTLFGLTPLEAIKGVTIHAAQALGLGHDTGSIELGKQADMVLFDIESPGELAYWIGGIRPVHIIRAGKLQH